MGHNDHLEDGPGLPDDSFVCARCVADEYLAHIVDSNAESNHCDYCGLQSKTSNAAPVDVIGKLIHGAIFEKYANAQDLNLPWDGGWILSETEISDIVEEFNPGWSDSFGEAILDSLDACSYWVKHADGDWMQSGLASDLTGSWHNFRRFVLERCRFLFLSELESEYEPTQPNDVPVRHMLDALGQIAATQPLVSTLPKGTSLYRVRSAQPGEHFSTFRDLSLPPRDISSSARMNPCGIPLFYTALEPHTAVRETIFRRQQRYFQAQFSTTRELNVLDLASRLPLPSIFDPALRRERHIIAFLNAFIDDIKRPIMKDDKEHIEYIPTQIVSEYFRVRFRDSNSELLDGLSYPSSQNDGGSNLVLFSTKHEDVKEIVSLASSITQHQSS